LFSGIKPGPHSAKIKAIEANASNTFEMHLPGIKKNQTDWFVFVFVFFLKL